MSDVAAIRGVTGPGKTTELVSAQFQEISIRLKKKVIEVVNIDGSTGFYDLAMAKSVQIVSDGDSFTVAIQMKEDESDGAEPKYAPGVDKDAPSDTHAISGTPKGRTVTHRP